VSAPYEIVKRVPWKVLAMELWRNRNEVLEAIDRLRPRKSDKSPMQPLDARLDDLVDRIEKAFSEVAEHLELTDRAVAAQRRRTTWALAVACCGLLLGAASALLSLLA
jgi:predicted nuclease with TOPRIM domain